MFASSPHRRSLMLPVVFALAGACAGDAQQVIPQPVTDSSVEASPLKPVPRESVNDASAQASPISPERSGASRFIAPHTAVSVTLGQAIDSGKLKQGDTVQARLAQSVPTHGGTAVAAGTPVTLTVIETVPAGRIMSQGEFSLQVLRVGGINVFTNTLVFDGKPGHQDLPDSAPALGTDAGLPKGAALTFHVLPQPTAASAAPSERSGGPGSVDGTANGGPPPKSSLKSTYGSANGAGSGNKPAQQQRAVSPADTTTNQQTQQMQQPSVAPNQPQSPSQTSPNSTAQPH